MDDFREYHEAIIDQQTFDLVQKSVECRALPGRLGRSSSLTGLLYCADCGGKMYIHRTNSSKRISQYTHSTQSSLETLCKDSTVSMKMWYCPLFPKCSKPLPNMQKHDRAEDLSVVQEAQSSQQTAEVRKQRTRATQQKRDFSWKSAAIMRTTFEAVRQQIRRSGRSMQGTVQAYR